MVRFPKSREYLEKLFSEAYKREIDQNENVWRTLPGFVTAAAFLVGANFYIISHEPRPQPFVHTIQLYYSFQVASLLCLGLGFLFLFDTIRGRDYRVLPFERDTLKFHKGMEAHYGAHGHLSSDGKDESVLTEVQSFMLDTLAEDVSFNRNINKGRYLSRARAAVLLMVGYACAAPPVILAARQDALEREAISLAGSANAGRSLPTAAAVATPTAAETSAPQE